MASTIAIGLATYKRPQMLTEALKSLEKVKVPASSSLILLLCDNDPEKTARPVYESQQPILNFPSYFLQESERGIVPTRNRIIEKALQLEADFLAFFDDDETVDENWLVALLQAAKIHDAEAVWGKTIYELPQVHPQWLSNRNFFGGSQPSTGTHRAGASTNNVLIDLHFLQKHNLRFDKRFNDVGGSDSFLFRQFWDHGGKVIACQESITYEKVPESRATKAWILRRAYKNAHTEYRRNTFRKGKIWAILVAFLYSFWLGISFLFSVVFYPFYQYDFKVYNKRRLAKIKGFRDAILGKTHDEYKDVHGS